MNKTLLALYGLKWNPFSPELPTEALYLTPAIEHFCWRIEQVQVREGGFALITGIPGTGKSVTLRLLASRLAQLPDLTVAALTHPSANLADFYRELGDLFGLALRPHNRWMGFKTLRERWSAHLESTLLRPAILIDEAQALSPIVLNELRLLASSRFDSRTLLCVVLCGNRALDLPAAPRGPPAAGQPHPRPTPPRARLPRGAPCLPRASDARRRQPRADDHTPHPRPGRPRPGQLPRAHHHGRRAPRRGR